MTADVYPLQVLLVTLAGWVNRHQQHVTEYLIEENRVLKGQLKGHRLRLTDDQRRRLAAKGQRLGRRVLRQVTTLVTSLGPSDFHRAIFASRRSDFRAIFIERFSP
jgi:putative transposase